MFKIRQFVMKAASPFTTHEWRICTHGEIDRFYDFLVILDSQTPKKLIKNTKNVISNFKNNFKFTEMSRDLKMLRDSV